MVTDNRIRILSAVLLGFLLLEAVSILGYESTLGHRAVHLISSNTSSIECPKIPPSQPIIQIVNASSEYSYLEDHLPVLKAPAPGPTIPSSIDETAVTAASCPRFEPYNKHEQAAKTFEDNCVSVPASGGDFKVDMCQSKVLCGQGYFKIERTDKKRCEKEMRMELSWNKNLDRYLKEEVGPDAFYVEFNGPERAVFPMWTHLGDCVYKHPFRLINPGAYTVSISHAYQSFDAVNELKDSWPEPVMKQLVKDYGLSVCPQCPVLTDARVDTMTLPLCSRVEPTQGIYIRINGETEREKYKLKNYNIPYIYVPLGCRFDQRFEMHANDSCINARTYHTLINGDSQSRNVWDLMDLRLAGITAKHEYNYELNHRETSYFAAADLPAGVANRYVAKDADMPDADARKGLKRLHNVYVGTETHLASHYDKIKEWDDQKKVSSVDNFFAPFDAVMVNVGQWSASGNWAGGHFSVERFVDLIEYASNSIAVVNSRRHIYGKEQLNYVWEGINGFKIETNKDGFAAHGADWRVNYRLRIYSEFAERVWRRRGVKMMNSFDMTLPWVQYSPDSAHVTNLPALDAQVDELLHKWNLCNV
ncbi:hypothetical protein BC830DRAFT_297069 [Chytriomyces sp. MP71]|nr:hypothetical protein BC830DRAFT_297069 [Chytriomyces sp. MP71]